MVMLSLQIDTPERWFSQVDENLDEILIDHAHCEKKAAGVAMNLLFAYVENTKISRAMTEIVNEELEHFHMVLDLLERRDIQFRKLIPSMTSTRVCIVNESLKFFYDRPRPSQMALTRSFGVRSIVTTMACSSARGSSRRSS